MFVTNYPRGYSKVGFCYSQLKKSPINRLKIRACSKSRRFCGDKSPRNRHEIAASLHERFGIATKIAAWIAAKIACVNGPFKVSLNNNMRDDKRGYDKHCLSVYDRLFFICSIKSLQCTDKYCKEVFFRSHFPFPYFDVPKASNFTSGVVQNRETKNRTLGMIVTSFQDFKLREKQISQSFSYCVLINLLRNGTVVRCL